MKQIDIIKTYSQKRCLIVEDNADVRTALKRILIDFGAVDVDTAGHAADAIENCERHQYDIVLADYNLGKGQNGQQLLEELRIRKLLQNTALFILITAESAVQHVVHALEHQPDDFLNKPINKEGLRPRLDAALLKNEALMPIKKELDLERPKRAIAACQTLLESKNKYHNDAKKMLGELFCQQKMYAEAQGLYQSFDEERAPLWVKLGLASALFGLKKYDRAEKYLLDVIKESQYCVEAHDLLAKIHEANNRFDHAQHVLTKAVQISPMSAARQREMGRVSNEIGDENAAAHAYRAAIKHSKNSSHEEPEDYAALADTLTELVNKGDSKADELAREAMDNLKQLDKRYAKQPVVQMRKNLACADLYQARGHTDKAEEANQAALAQFEELRLSAVENTPTELSISCAKAFMERGLYDAGEKLLQEVAKFTEDPELSVKIDKLLREPVTKEGIAYAAKLNKQGIEFHKGNQFDNAIEAFQQVLKELPNHVGLNLNLVQTLVAKSKETELSESEISLMACSFKRVGQMRENSPYSERYNYLIKRFEKLSKEQ